jgi:carbon monoxide dehydrogenase subunit G
MARREISVSVDIDAPVETVWAEVMDWESQGEWMLGTDVRVTQGDGKTPGTRVAAFTGIGPLGVTDTIELVGWDPPHRATVRHVGRIIRGSGVFTVVQRIGPDGRAGSTFTMAEQLDLPLGPLGALGWPLAKPVFAWGLRYSLAELARRCERSGAR